MSPKGKGPKAKTKGPKAKTKAVVPHQQLRRSSSGSTFNFGGNEAGEEEAAGEEAAQAQGEEAGLGQDVNRELACKRRRRLCRSDTDVAVEEKIESRLKGYNRMSIDTAVGNTTGQSVAAYLADKTRANRSTKSRANSKFWTDFFEEFDLYGDVFTDMATQDEAAGEGNDICDAILEGIRMAHHKNPAYRSVETFSSELEYIEDASLAELKFMVEASRQSPIVVRKHSLKMFACILKVACRCVSFYRVLLTCL